MLYYIKKGNLMEKYYLVSSNKDKLKEFKNILPEIKLKNGIDLK